MIRPTLFVVTMPGRSPVDQRLSLRAVRLYPDSPYLQREWLRAVAVVRSTSRGWHLDQPVERRQ
jgi:hypothetical protein